jgi:diguanylate cyclase (GGDEF)-like protein
MNAKTEPHADAFEAHLQVKSVAGLKLGARLAAVLVLVFWMTDWLLLPQYVQLSLWIRLGCMAYTLLILAVIQWRPGWVRRHVKALAISLATILGWMVVVLCWLDHPYESPYYAGLSLVIMAVGYLFAWPWRTAAWFLIPVYGLYMAPVLLGLLPIGRLNVAIANQFFLLSTIVIMLMAQRHRLSVEQREFSAQQQQLELLRQIHTLATTDALTGVSNRRQLFARGETELPLALRHGRPLSVLMLDIDNFKAVNDMYGHDVGDQVLRSVAELLSANSRREDIVARYGGEEFIVILPETEPDAACKHMAERIRSSLEQTVIQTSQGPLQVTASIGIAPVTPSTSSLVEVIRRADQALYAAKHSGRNCIRVWPASQPQPRLSLAA